MATQFSVPASPKKNILVIDNFLGVDLTNTGSNVSENRSPNAPNLIRDVPGKVRKRTGYKTLTDLNELPDFEGGIVYGAHIIKNSSEATIMKRNLCSMRSLTYENLEPGDSIYIYSNNNCLPAGAHVHIQFQYHINGVLQFTPYYENPEYTQLNAIDSDANFCENYELIEATNAFELKNVSDEPVNVFLNDVMIYLNEVDEPFNDRYSSYSEVSETRLYSLGTDNLLGSANGSVSDEDTTTVLDVNTDIKGLLMVSFLLKINNMSEGTIKDLKIGFKGTRIDAEGIEEVAKLAPELHYTSYASSGYLVSCIVDPAINHKDYDIDTSIVTSIVATVESTSETFTADIEVSDIHFRNISLKEDFDTQDYTRLIHAGSQLYLEVNGTYSLLTSEMNKARSSSWQNEKRLFIIDGKNFFIYDNEDYSLLNPSKIIPTSYDNTENKVYVPRLTIAKSPRGGGVSYEDRNLLTPAFCESFIVEEETQEDTNFQLSFMNLDSDKEVKVWVLNGDGDFIEKKIDVDYRVKHEEGVIEFINLPGKSPTAGEDNVMILAYRTSEGNIERISECSVGALFGVNGAADRLFLSGNPRYLNYDWHSGQYQYDYFPDTGYAKLGSDSSAIVGYSIVNNYLATHKDENDPTQAVIIREGDLIVSGETQSTDGKTTIYDQEPAFKIINTLQGNGAVCSKSFATLQTEPVFLTKSGIFAITPQDMTGEKYSQSRSFFVNGRLNEEPNLEDACAIVYDDMYFLFINSRVYVLDGLQAVQTDKSAPYSTRQYAAFLLTDIPASIAWVENGEIWFGTTEGKLCKFYKDKEALLSYNDDGKPISAWWETADLDGNLFYKNKTFRYIAVRLKSNIMSRAKLWAQSRGLWVLIKESKLLSNITFKFSELSFSSFTFNHDVSDPVISSKLRVKKIDKARFKIENSNLNEPFGIQNLALEYVQGGNFKG